MSVALARHLFLVNHLSLRRMAYIEENIKKRRGDSGTKPKQGEGPRDPYEELYRIADRYNPQKDVDEEGNVTNSLAMLTAIPEVDLGMEYVHSFLLGMFRSHIAGK